MLLAQHHCIEVGAPAAGLDRVTHQTNGYQIAEGKGFAAVLPTRRQGVEAVDHGQIQHPLAHQLQGAPSHRLESLDIPGVVLPLQPAPAKAQQLGGLPQGGQDGVVGVGPVLAVGFAEIQAELIADAAVQARNGALVAVGQGRHNRSAGSDLQQIQNWQTV